MSGLSPSQGDRDRQGIERTHQRSGRGGYGGKAGGHRDDSAELLNIKPYQKRDKSGLKGSPFGDRPAVTDRKAATPVRRSGYRQVPF
jgi:hypothetical protein